MKLHLPGAPQAAPRLQVAIASHNHTIWSQSSSSKEHPLQIPTTQFHQESKTFFLKRGMKRFSLCIRIFPFLHTVFHLLIHLSNISCASTLCYVQLGTERRVPQSPSLLQRTVVPHCNCAFHPISKPPAPSPWVTWHQRQKIISFLLSATTATENKEHLLILFVIAAFTKRQPLWLLLQKVINSRAQVSGFRVYTTEMASHTKFGKLTTASK